jgi:hypothetical protein
MIHILPQALGLDIDFDPFCPALGGSFHPVYFRSLEASVVGPLNASVVGPLDASVVGPLARAIDMFLLLCYDTFPF